MSDFGEMLEYLFKDKRTKIQKFKDRCTLILIIIVIIMFFIGIGILIS